MASEYLKWKYRDVKPDEAPRELTGEEKRRNWWDYHKWHVVIGAVAAVCAVLMLLDMLGVGEVKPDYQIAYVGETILPEGTVTALQNGLAAAGEDLNGDGRVTVLVHQYTDINVNEPWGDEEADAEAAQQAQITQAALIADLEFCDSFLFLLEDPASFQERYEILASPDGSLPENGPADTSEVCLPWQSSPFLSGLDLGTVTTVMGAEADSQQLLSGLYIARRGFWSGKTCENLEGCERLWDKIRRDEVPQPATAP